MPRAMDVQMVMVMLLQNEGALLLLRRGTACRPHRRHRPHLCEHARGTKELQQT